MQSLQSKSQWLTAMSFFAVFAVIAAIALLTGCSGGQRSLVPPVSPESVRSTQGASPVAKTKLHQATSLSSNYVYVSDRTASGASQIVVYNAGIANPAPVRTITQKIVDAAGVAVDPAGDVFVANGSAGNVLEYSPGGTSLLKTYSQGLTHPISVAIANGTLYVADQGSPANGYAQQVFEYTIGNGK